MEGETLKTLILFCLSHNRFANYYYLKHFETSILKMIPTCKCLGFTSLFFFPNHESVFQYTLLAHSPCHDALTLVATYFLHLKAYNFLHLGDIL